MIDMLIRAPRAGDGAGIPPAWCDFAEFYREIAPEAFQSPRQDGLDEWLERTAGSARPGHGTEVARRSGGCLPGFRGGVAA
ncbi:hypothetical protein GCM10010191_95930 [Actinomadura vinacea]|uniref:GNAT family N-acetyltransferase n=1 Tax=Actinomadura vinacea TaxID=115336 RepID=A0ABN3KHS0_9ACTN